MGERRGCHGRCLLIGGCFRWEWRVKRGDGLRIWFGVVFWFASCGYMTTLETWNTWQLDFFCFILIYFEKLEGAVQIAKQFPRSWLLNAEFSILITFGKLRIELFWLLNWDGWFTFFFSLIKILNLSFIY